MPKYVVSLLTSIIGMLPGYILYTMLMHAHLYREYVHTPWMVKPQSLRKFCNMLCAVGVVPSRI